MKNMLLLLLFAAATPRALFSQSNPEIASWVSSHPGVYIISFDNFQKMSDARKEQLADHLIVFHGEIKLEQLIAYDAEKSIPVESVLPTKPQDAQEIKNWVGIHQNVEIIKRSVFESMSVEDQQIHLINGSLVLAGESITIQDVRNY